MKKNTGVKIFMLSEGEKFCLLFKLPSQEQMKTINNIRRKIENYQNKNDKNVIEIKKILSKINFLDKFLDEAQVTGYVAKVVNDKESLQSDKDIKKKKRLEISHSQHSYIPIIDLNDKNEKIKQIEELTLQKNEILKKLEQARKNKNHKNILSLESENDKVGSQITRLEFDLKATTSYEKIKKNTEHYQDIISKEVKADIGTVVENEGLFNLAQPCGILSIQSEQTKFQPGRDLNALNRNIQTTYDRFKAHNIKIDIFKLFIDKNGAGKNIENITKQYEKTNTSSIKPSINN